MDDVAAFVEHLVVLGRSSWTVRTYRLGVEHFRRWLVPHSFDDVTRSVVCDYVLDFAERVDGGCAPRTVNCAGGLETGFAATAGNGSRIVGICAEMDALPDIGHGCGHNASAASATAAAVALAPLVVVLDLTLRVFGTPAEERGAGEGLLIEAVFSMAFVRQ
ncbi:MAG: hypothetical protein EOP24_42465 [Hyphomicrobiales bacterium]|nr:MAG: hypothetical protein EOP24_42465 [Hyphomicrobiales bacterium]